MSPHHLYHRYHLKLKLLRISDLFYLDDEWIEIAKTNGLSPEEIKALTKHEIIQLLRKQKAP